MDAHEQVGKGTARLGGGADESEDVLERLDPADEGHRRARLRPRAGREPVRVDAVVDDPHPRGIDAEALLPADVVLADGKDDVRAGVRRAGDAAGEVGDQRPPWHLGVLPDELQHPLAGVDAVLADQQGNAGALRHGQGGQGAHGGAGGVRHVDGGQRHCQRAQVAVQQPGDVDGVGDGQVTEGRCVGQPVAQHLPAGGVVERRAQVVVDRVLGDGREGRRERPGIALRQEVFDDLCVGAQERLGRLAATGEPPPAGAGRTRRCARCPTAAPGSSGCSGARGRRARRAGCRRRRRRRTRARAAR